MQSTSLRVRGLLLNIFGASLVLSAVYATPALATPLTTTSLNTPAVASKAMAYPSARSYFEARVDLSEEDQSRIARHLAAVEAELRARPTDHLSESQRKNRLARLDDLHTYWTRAEFPQNRDFPDRLVPYFIDAQGVPCAMARGPW